MYQGDTSVPASTANDYTVRTRLLEAAIRDWDSEQGVLWKELWELLSNASDGTKLTAAATTAYTAPSNFRFPGGFVRLKDAAGNSTFFPVFTPDRIELHRNESINLCFFTGNKSAGYKCNFLVTPTPAGLTIEYPYYKDPTFPTAAANVIEMSEPMFAVRHVLSKLLEIDGEGDRSALELSRAQAILRSMKFRNEMPPFMQENQVLDRDMDTGTKGFGR